MNRFRRTVRRVVFAASLALILTVVSIPSNRVSSSAAYYSYLITYYSDATHTQEVGSRYVDCNGHSVYLDGHSSSYQQSEIVDVCCRDPGGNGWVPC
ncbi:MAG: hypothetical protein QOH49_488 [Acidobacteriota bacterium]|nr:hypothetical protein [Acidobacteriota bacterium]MDX6484707.1 hypothetical protein [Gaiellaceae bacterium]